MMTSRTVNIYGYISLAVMAVILLLMWQRMVPERWYWALFSVALVLFLFRVTMRLLLARQKRQQKNAEGVGASQAGKPGEG